MTDGVQYRTCPLCEATCGLEVTVRDGAVERIRGDAEDVLSHGFLCPKGIGLKELHSDPDRLRTPLRRTGDGFEPIGWDEAFALIDEGLGRVLADGQRDAVGVYVGNPTAHNLSSMLYGRVLIKGLGSRNVYSASTVDQFPKQLASAYLFGTGTTVAVPDLDRCEWLLVLGANPVASNGSLMTAPDARGRLRGIQRRGGRVVVVDPRRSRTAELADEHVSIVPGTDALLLFAMVHVLFEEGLVDLGPLAPLVAGVEAVGELAADFAPEAVAAVCGVDADVIRRLARELAAAPRGCVYGRIGTTTQAFGTLTSWLVDVLNVLTGNLDREGGAMFPQAAAALAPGPPREVRVGRWSSRVRGLGEIFGELPVACLAEEIETPGDGRIRAMITMAGNPVVSTPNSARLAAALERLDFMVSLDVYVNETTRFADVILPAPSPLERAHYDLALYGFSVRNVANYSPPLFESPVPDEWRTLVRLAGVVTGQGADCDVDALDDAIAGDLAGRGVVDAEAVAGRRGPERLLDIMLRAGPYPITLSDLEAAPHGIDLGPLQPRLPEVLRTPSGRIELGHPAFTADVERLHEALAAGPPADGELLLIGRRDLRSNNSWMHNLPLLVRGPARCTVHVHPDDAARCGLTDGEPAVVRSRVGEIELPVQVTDAIRPGVVSIPHGWGHDAPGVQLGVAREHAGANSNVLADETLVDGPSGNAVLNGIPVQLARVPSAAAVA
jgi:anaerobic selenocysteine-containing dehydrogenase